MTQVDWDFQGSSVIYNRSATYNAKGQLATDVIVTRKGGDSLTANSTYSYGTGNAYALGAVVTIATANSKNGGGVTNALTTNNYLWYEGAVQGSVVYKPNTSQSAENRTNFEYANVGGQSQLLKAVIADGRARSVTYTNDLNGQVLKRDEQDNVYTQGDPHEIWYRFGGKQMGYVGNNSTTDLVYGASVAQRGAAVPSGTPGAFRNGATSGASYSDFDQSYNPINSYEQGSASAGYIVRKGDTLAGIAAGLYGDSSLWYKIAEVNGLSGNAALIEGQSLTLPAGVIRNTNNASTFQPYDPASTIGDTAPSAIAAAPPKKKGCGGLGQILLAVVALAVTIATKGAAGKLFTGLFSSVGASTGVAAAAGSVVGVAAAAATGSIVSQSVGVATGIQEKFSWKAVALSALAGGIGAGFSGASLGISNPTLQAMARGAVSSALTQGIGVITGLQDKFSWAGVAAAGVGAGVGRFVAGKLGGAVGSRYTNGAGDLMARVRATFSNTLGSSMAGGIANAATRTLIEGTDFGDNIAAALPDIIGNAIGGALLGANSPKGDIVVKSAAQIQMDELRQLSINNQPASLASPEVTAEFVPPTLSAAQQNKAIADAKALLASAATSDTLSATEKADVNLSTRALNRPDTRVEFLALASGTGGNAQIIDGVGIVRINTNSPALYLTDGSVNVARLASVLAHEGRHIHDFRFYGNPEGLRTIGESRRTERNAYRTQAAYNKANGFESSITGLDGQPAILTRENANVAAERSVQRWVTDSADQARAWNRDKLPGINKEIRSINAGREAYNLKVQEDNRINRERGFTSDYELKPLKPLEVPRPIPVYSPPRSYN